LIFFIIWSESLAASSLHLGLLSVLIAAATPQPTPMQNAAIPLLSGLVGMVRIYSNLKSCLLKTKNIQ